MLTAHLQARMFELEAVRTWERNPQFYSDLLASSLAGQTLFTHAPARRARAPRALEAAPDAAPDSGGARQHQGSARHLRQGRHRDDARRAEVHRRGSAARLRRRRRSAPARRSRRRADRGVAGGRRLRRSISKPSSRRRRAPPSGSDATSSSRSCASRKGIALPVDRLLAIATRELQATQEAFRSLAGKMNGGDPMAAWAKTKAQHPAPGELVATGRAAARRARDVSRAPDDHLAAVGRADHRRADARLLSLVVRQHVDAGPVREQADARLLLPDRRRSVVAGRAPGRAPARLQLPDAVVDLDSRGLPGTLPALPAPAPVESKARKSIMFAPASFVEGWAHYCEQMMIEAGFGRQDPTHQARTARRGADPPRPLHRLHQAARRRHVGRAGRALLPRRGVHGREQRAARSRARRVRSDLSRLHRRQADAAEAAAGLQAAAGQGVFAAHRFTTRCSARAPRRSGSIVS